MTRPPSRSQRSSASTRPDRASTVSWTLAVAVHLGLLAIAANLSWVFRLDSRAPERTQREPTSERISFTQLVVPETPPVRPKVNSSAAARTADSPARHVVVDEAPPSMAAPGLISVPPARTLGDPAPERSVPPIETSGLSLSAIVGTGATGVARRIDSLGASVRAAITTATDAIAREEARKRAESTWTVNALGRVGVSPMRVHLGFFEVPVPVKVVSLGEFDQHRRERRSTLEEVHRQSARSWRDSVVNSRIAAVRERAGERRRPPP
jgi:hypothetical protein